MRIINKKLFLVLFWPLLLAGCSIYRIDSESTTLDFYPPKETVKDVIYLEKVDKPVEVVGMVTVSVENGKPFEDVLTKIRNEAAVLGGDAVTGVRLEPEGFMRTRYTARVLVFK